MKTALFTIACMAFLGRAEAQDNTLHHPESINTDGKFLYVSDIGSELQPVNKDGDGAIRKYTLDGKLVKANITKEKLNAPKGSAIVNGILYVADIDRVVGISLATGKKTAEFSMAAFGSSFANDITEKDDHTIFVSLTDVGKIIEINTGTKTMQELPLPVIKGANGLAFDKTAYRLYVCTFSMDGSEPGGEIGMIGWDREHCFYEKLGDVHGQFDGIAVTSDHKLIVSDWVDFNKTAGVIRKIDPETKASATMDLPLIAGPADICFDEQRHTLYIPVMITGSIMINKL